MSAYNGGLDLLRDIATLDLRWLLLNDVGYVFDKDHRFVTDLTPGTNEPVVSGYGRIALTGPGRTIDDTLDRMVYAADDPDFGPLGAGENIAAAVLFSFVTDDTDSPLISYKPFTGPPVATDALASFLVHLAGGIVAYLD